MPRVTYRPRKLRRISWVAAPVAAVVFLGLGLLLQGDTGEGQATYQGSDKVAMALLGLFVAAGILALGRPRIVADAERVQVRNLVGGYDLPWTAVRAVRFDRDRPWASLELENDDVIAVMAVLATDREYAVGAVRSLRALHAQAHAAVASGGPDPAVAETAD